MSNKSMFKVSVEGQEDILVPSRELADKMATLFDDSVVTEVGRKEALASVRLSTKKVEVPSVWLELLADIKTLVYADDATSRFADTAGPSHGAVALCAIIDANKGEVSMTVRNVAGNAKAGKVYVNANGQAFDSLAQYIHLNGGTITGLYAGQAASQYNRVEGEPKFLKQKEA